MQRILWAGLVLAPLVFVLDRLGVGDVTLFILAAAALIPLAWLIGEATEHAAHHTGPGIGGFINATFGNAPELIIALFAVADGLTDVVLGSLTGSVIGNLLLVLGFSLVAGGRGRLDRWSSFVSFALIGFSVALFLIPTIAGTSGDPQRHSLALLSLPISIVLLLVYVAVTFYALRRHHELHAADEPASMRAWSLRRSLIVLGIATAVTAVVAEILVSSIETFAETAGLTNFFVAAIIVAVVGNAAEHGGAIVVAARGKIKLAAEIALSSSAQVAVFLIPVVQILSFAIEPLALSFPRIEIAALGGALLFTIGVLAGGRSSRARGVLLVAAYVGIAIAFFFAPEQGADAHE